MNHSCPDLLVYDDMGCYLGLLILGGGTKVGSGRAIFLNMNCHCRQKKQK